MTKSSASHMRLLSFATAMAIAAVSCSLEVRTILSAPSPNHRLVAEVVSRAPLSLADKNNYLIYVSVSSQSERSKANRRLVWSSEGVNPTWLCWEGDSRLRVGVLQSTFIRWSSISETPPAGIELETWVTPSSQESDKCLLSRRLEIARR